LLSRDTRNEKKLKAIRRAEFGLRQRLERIDWEEDELLPEVNAFKARAQLPELPNETIVSVTFDRVDDDSRDVQD
jgi:hypothetical protein